MSHHYELLTCNILVKLQHGKKHSRRYQVSCTAPDSDFFVLQSTCNTCSNSSLVEYLYHKVNHLDVGSLQNRKTAKTTCQYMYL